MASEERKSSRLSEKKKRVFRMPSREERLAATDTSPGTSPGSSSKLSDLSPPKKVSNFTRITHRYNADNVDVYDSASDMEDFINDDDGEDEYSPADGGSSDDPINEDSGGFSDSEQSEPPIKKRKKRRFSRIQKVESNSESEEDETMSKPDGSENKQPLEKAVANLSCSDGAQMSESNNILDGIEPIADSDDEFGKSQENGFHRLSSSGISVGHSPTQALSSDFEDDDIGPGVNHKIGGALSSDSEDEGYERLPVRKSGGIHVFRHTSCSADSSESGDPYAFGGINQFPRVNTCGSLNSNSDKNDDGDDDECNLSAEVLAEMDTEFTEELESGCPLDEESDENEDVFRKLNASKNASMRVNSESEDSDVVTRSGGRKISRTNQEIESSDSECEGETTPQRPRSKRALKMSARKGRWKEETLGALEEERKRRKKETN